MSMNRLGNPFQSPEQQQNELMNQGWDKFNEATAAINEENKKTDKEKQVKQIGTTVPDANFCAEESLKGHETTSSALE